MFFKNIFVYQLDAPLTLSAFELDTKLSQYALRTCGAQELSTSGWLPAFKYSKEWASQLENFIFLRLGMHEKVLPRAAIDYAIEQKALEMNEALDSRAQRKMIEDIVMPSLINKALTVCKSIRAYIDLERQWLVVDAASEKKAAQVTALLRETLGSLSVVRLAPKQSISAVMTNWAKFGLIDDALILSTDIAMKSSDQEAQAHIKGLDLHADEIQQHLSEHWQVNKLSFCYRDQVMFSLGQDGLIKRLKLTDSYTETLTAEDDILQQQHADALLCAKLCRELIFHVFTRIDHQS